MRIQTLAPENAVERLDEGVVGQCPGDRPAAWRGRTEATRPNETWAMDLINDNVRPEEKWGADARRTLLTLLTSSESASQLLSRTCRTKRSRGLVP